MLKKLFLVLALCGGFSAQAGGFIDVKSLMPTIAAEDVTAGLPWKVGETADYDLNLGGFLPGSMQILVRELTSEGFWIEQNIDIMIQKSKVEMLIDKDTGQVKKVIVDGKEQKMEEGNDSEIVESKPDTVTVPAGTFECAYLKIRNKKDNSEAEMWINPELVPILGLIKQVAASQMGPVTISLKSFVKK